jgi:hypothetical protein
MTAGEINKQIIQEGSNSNQVQYPVGSTHAIGFQRPNSFTPQNKSQKDIYGNWSKNAKNWICGPTHQVQQQHIPGYTGHVSGIISENIFAHSYAKCSATVINKRHPVGHDVTPKIRYLSQNKAEFNAKNFRRFGKN